jgi:MEMO1 family protein
MPTPHNDTVEFSCSCLSSTEPEVSKQPRSIDDLLEELFLLSLPLLHDQRPVKQPSSELLNNISNPFGLLLEDEEQNRFCGSLNIDKSIIEVFEQTLRAFKEGFNQNSESRPQVRYISFLSNPEPLPLENFLPHLMQHSDEALLTTFKNKSCILPVQRLRALPDPQTKIIQLLKADFTDWQANRIKLQKLRVNKYDPLLGNNARHHTRSGCAYPRTAAALDSELEHLLPEQAPPTVELCKALLLPTAGWRFCGKVLANTLSQTRIADTVIILMAGKSASLPSVALPSAELLTLPNAIIPVDKSLMRNLSRNFPYEPTANLQDSEIEICEPLLPLLHRCNPKIQIVPILIGQPTTEELSELSFTLGSLIHKCSQPVTIVTASNLSSDLPANRTRHFDELTLKALETGNPVLLNKLHRRFDYNSSINMLLSLTLTTLQQFEETNTCLTTYTTSLAKTMDFTSVTGYAGAVIT